MAEVDARVQAVVLDGIDTARRVCVDAVYLGRTTDDGAPALQHAYAATTYQAQGSTVDRAYVMADPSMDRQELYVAASRSREETWLYATPEVQVDRDEYAPRSPHLREGLEHIAEAAERDGAQVAAHDEALRGELQGLSTRELHERPEQLRSAARAEQAAQARSDALAARISDTSELRDRNAGRAEAARELSRRQREDALHNIESRGRLTQRSLERLEGQAADLPPVGHEARAQLVAVEHALAEQERMALFAARISPPSYIVRELGERPSDPVKREVWDRAVWQIEGYRQRRGIVDKDRALGLEPKALAAQRSHEQARRTLAETQRRLDLGRGQAVARSQVRGIET